MFEDNFVVYNSTIFFIKVTKKLINLLISKYKLLFVNIIVEIS